jgi:hypothetical protein
LRCIWTLRGDNDIDSVARVIAKKTCETKEYILNIDDYIKRAK